MLHHFLRSPHVKLGVSLVGGLLLLGVGLSILSPKISDNQALAEKAKQAQDTPLAAPANVVASRIPSGENQLRDAALAQFLSEGIWREENCDANNNFQSFRLDAGFVEVGAGFPGQGERLRVVGIRKRENMLEVETQVCAPEPIGCNQTYEQYQFRDDDTMSEWHFEGRLPGQAPYVLVAEGMTKDNTGPGRVFVRCQR